MCLGLNRRRGEEEGEEEKEERESIETKRRSEKTRR